MAATREDVLARLRSVFPDSEQAAALAQLDRYGAASHEAERDRVHLALLQLCKGDLAALAKLVDTAKTDYRDILAWQQLGPLNPAEGGRLQQEARALITRWDTAAAHDADAEFRNVYEESRRANAYATLEFPGTYYLAYRDLPEIIRAHVPRGRALDFGCGAGRSSRFVRDLGFAVTGVDIAAAMLEHARARDAGGDYRLVPDGDLSSLPADTWDLITAIFTFDNIPTMEKKVALFAGLARLLRKDGRIVSLVSSPEIYVNEWVSFSTRDFPENRGANSGDTVKVVMLDVEDQRPVEDIYWTDASYREVYRQAGLMPIACYRPLGRDSDPHAWTTEKSVAPWTIYVLARS